MVKSLNKFLNNLLIGTFFGSIFTLSSYSQEITRFIHLNRYEVEGSVAEIIATTPDGNTLVFTNADDKAVGFLDISDTLEPIMVQNIDLKDLGEPTAVTITPDGKYTLVAILDTTEDIASQKQGILLIIDTQTYEIITELELIGIGPDSLAITPDGNKVVIAIEDEEDEDNLPGDRPGSVNIVHLNYDDLSNSEVINIALDLSDISGVNYQSDPQPEYVTISPDGMMAAVSLQENNAIALIDLSTEEVSSIFSAGITTHDQADLIDDDSIILNQFFQGRREPDSLAFVNNGQYIVSANEGETKVKTFDDGIYGGGRGWSIFDLEGNIVYDSLSELEELAAIYGHYPDGRSEKKGIEIEGITTAIFNEQEFVFVASERGDFIAIYDITNITEPTLVNFLPTGKAPEGVLAIPQRNLLLTANEKDGTIDFFEAM